MKQTVEKASIEYAESVIRSFGICGVPIGISDIKEIKQLLNRIAIMNKL
jgi:hypothetical protein